MAVPGTVFEGSFEQSAPLSRPEMLRALRWKEAAGPADFGQAANAAAEKLLAIQRRYAEGTGLQLVVQSIDRLSERLQTLREDGRGCLICFGWGTGFLAKSASADVNANPFGQILRSLPVYGQALRSGLPFPKTRRIVFLNDQPAALPGWAELTFDAA